MEKHTPGEWRVGGANENVVYATEPEIGRVPVAHCNATGEVPDGVDQANARLIAAAPDLLAALEVVSEWFDNTQADGYEPSPMVQQVRAAIARATS